MCVCISGAIATAQLYSKRMVRVRCWHDKSRVTVARKHLSIYAVRACTRENARKVVHCTCVCECVLAICGIFLSLSRDICINSGSDPSARSLASSLNNILFCLCDESATDRKRGGKVTFQYTYMCDRVCLCVLCEQHVIV